MYKYKEPPPPPPPSPFHREDTLDENKYINSFHDIKSLHIDIDNSSKFKTV